MDLPNKSSFAPRKDLRRPDVDIGRLWYYLRLENLEPFAGVAMFWLFFHETLTKSTYKSEMSALPASGAHHMPLRGVRGNRANTLQSKRKWQKLPLYISVGYIGLAHYEESLGDDQA